MKTGQKFFGELSVLSLIHQNVFSIGIALAYIYTIYKVQLADVGCGPDLKAVKINTLNYASHGFMHSEKWNPFNLCKGFLAPL